MSWEQTADNHRGPFSLVVCRPFVTKPGFFRTEWLKGTVEADEVLSEARSLLQDPRDTICNVNIWSEREEQFLFGFRKSDFKEAAPARKPGGKRSRK